MIPALALEDTLLRALSLCIFLWKGSWPPHIHTYTHSFRSDGQIDGKHFHLRGLKTFFQKAILRLGNRQNPNEIKSVLLLCVFIKVLFLLPSHIWQNEAQWNFPAALGTRVGPAEASAATAWRDSLGPRSPPDHVACVKMTNLILVVNYTRLSLWHRMLYWCLEIDGPMKQAGQAAKSARCFDWLELSYSWTLKPRGRFI